MKKKYLIITISILISIFASAQKDVTVPDAFGFDSAQGGSSSVNQSNGKLNIGLNLVTLKGYKDLAASFSISYDGSSVTKTVKSSNEYIPTGVLGLGWGTSFSRIVADNKLTSARDDDDYYMLGGGLTKLVGIARTGSRIEFELQTYKPWKIYFYPTQEKWEVIKENGYKYTYENVDWSVYWENWIGNSNQSGAERQGSSWNLTKVEDLHGNTVLYEYINVEQSLTNTWATKHTETTYLSKIIGPSGEEIRLQYYDKEGNEYHDPNTNQSEPDAYQENYQKKYLKWVEVFDTEQNLMYKYKFDYEMIGSNDFRKRLLEKITLINSTGQNQLFRKFEYDNNSYSDFYGHIMHQILPTQGRVSYQYAVNEIEINQVTEGSAPGNSNYIVQGNYIYGGGMMRSWNGSSWEVQGLPLFGGSQEIQLVVKDKFIAALWRHNNATHKYRAYGLSEDGYTWISYEGTISSGKTPALVSGEDFFAVGYSDKRKLLIHNWNGYQWGTYSDGDFTNGKYFYTASNNYVIRNRRLSGQDQVQFFYFDATNQLQVKWWTPGFSTAGGSCSNNPENCPGNFWYSQNSFAQANINGNPEYLIRWDKDYNYLGKLQLGTWPDHIRTYGLYNNMFATTEESGVFNQYSISRFVRYLGNANIANVSFLSAPFNDDVNLVGLGSDIIVHPNDGDTGNSMIRFFNANIGQWQLNQYSANGGGIDNKDKMSFDFFGRNLIFANRTLYRRNSNFSFSTLGTYPSNTILTKSDGGNLLYLSSRDGNRVFGSAFAKILALDLDNNLWQFPIPSQFYLKKNPNDRMPKHAIGGGTIMVSKENTGGYDPYKIYKFIDNKLSLNAQGQGIYRDIVVVKETFDPVLTRKQRTYFCYSNPRISKDNNRVYYSQVASQNDLNGINGRSVTFYDTGLDDERMIGLPTKKQVYDANDKLISEEQSFWQIRQNYVDGIYHINLDKKRSKNFEGNQTIESETDYTYDNVTGLLKKTRTRDSEGYTHFSESTYLFEEYSQATDYNLISPIIYTRSYVQKSGEPTTYLSSTAVKWDFSSIPVPIRSYTWEGTGSVGFDFSTNNNNFRLSQYLSKYDTYGNLVEERNQSSVVTSYLYGYQGKRLVAKIEGATYSQVSSNVNMSIINNPTSDTQLRQQMSNLRVALPNAFITSYTYDNLSIGVSSITDVRGRIQSYFYDNFYRLDYVTNNEGEILKKNSYQYRTSPFVYETESTALPNCELINTTIGGDPSNQDPLTLLLEFSGIPNDQRVTFRVIASDGGNYQVNFYPPQGENWEDYQIYQTGNNLVVRNDNCIEGTVTVTAKITGYNPVTQQNEVIISNTLLHTFTDNTCIPD